jgi:hypothetical protein
LYAAGLLSAVGDLNAISDESKIYLTWIAPFSLRITGHQNIIHYCVNISTSPPQFLCGINETEYSITLPPNSGCDEYYNISVTPVNVVGRGEPSTAVLLQTFGGT